MQLSNDPNAILSAPVANNLQQGVAGQSTIVLATALVRCQNGINVSKPIRAICDTGAQMNLMTMDCAKRNNLLLKPCSKSLVGIGGTGNEAKKRTVAHIIPWFKSTFAIYAEVLIVDQLDGIFPSYPIDAKSIPTDIQLADPQYDTPAPIEMLLGAESWAIFMLPQMYIRDGSAIVHNTQLGHIVLGRFQVKNDDDDDKLLSVFQANESLNCNEFSKLYEQMRGFWEIEKLEENKQRSPEEDAVEKHFLSTHYRNEAGRYVVEIPIKQNSLPLGDSRGIALRQFFQLERRLTKKSSFTRKIRGIYA